MELQSLCWIVLVIVQLLQHMVSAADTPSSTTTTRVNDGITAFPSDYVCDAAVKGEDLEGKETKASTEASPFKIEVNTTTYIPGHIVAVTITGSQLLVGVILQARRYGTKDTIGKFIQLPLLANIKTCNQTNDTVAAWFTNGRSNAQFYWMSPEGDHGMVQFVGTLYQSETKYWANILSVRNLPRGFTPIDLSTCGKSKGCFRHSKNGGACQHKTCTYVVTYRKDTTNAYFEMSAMGKWAAIGFSSDNLMGGDDVLMCVQTSRGGEVRHCWNSLHNQPPTQTASPTYDHEVYFENGRISCRFARPLQVRNDKTLDMTNDWYQLYTWGDISYSNSLMKHAADPPVSTQKITLAHRLNVISACSTCRATFYHLSLCCCVWLFLKFSTG